MMNYQIRVIATIILALSMIGLPPQVVAGSCYEAALECWMAPGPCEQVHCARRNINRCPNQYTQIQEIIATRQAMCDAQKNRPTNWSKSGWNNIIDNIGDVSDQIGRIDTNWQRDQQLRQIAINTTNGLYYYRNAVTGGVAATAFLGAIYFVSWPWALGIGAAGIVAGWYSPDLFASVTERMFTN